jgi:hypothetical protein
VYNVPATLPTIRMPMSPRLIDFLFPLFMPIFIGISLYALLFAWWPTDDAGRKLCDSAVAELVKANDQLSLDRAEFVIKRENCGISRRVTNLAE